MSTTPAPTNSVSKRWYWAATSRVMLPRLIPHTAFDPSTLYQLANHFRVAVLCRRIQSAPYMLVHQQLRSRAKENLDRAQSVLAGP